MCFSFYVRGVAGDIIQCILYENVGDGCLMFTAYFLFGIAYMDVGKGREQEAEALRVSPRWRVTLLLQPKRVTRLILPGAKLNSRFMADP